MPDPALRRKGQRADGRRPGDWNANCMQRQRRQDRLVRGHAASRRDLLLLRGFGNRKCDFEIEVVISKGVDQTARDDAPKLRYAQTKRTKNTKSAIVNGFHMPGMSVETQW